jgi:hypothetical protein
MRVAANRNTGIAACLLFVALLLPLPATPAASPAEHQVKAVYLFNFGQFVEWPPRAYAAADAPFVIGIIGDDLVARTLEEVVRGESVHGRNFEVRRLDKPAQAGQCHILFIGRADAARLDEALAAARGRSVLTVTDIDGAERRGAMVVLFTENKRIRMRINLAAARASELVISSKLLRPAIIHEGAGGGP